MFPKAVSALTTSSSLFMVVDMVSEDSTYQNNAFVWLVFPLCLGAERSELKKRWEKVKRLQTVASELSSVRSVSNTRRDGFK